MDNLFWVALAALAGASIPFNAAFNARLGIAGGSPTKSRGRCQGSPPTSPPFPTMARLF
jgi:hypothetical protein